MILLVVLLSTNVLIAQNYVIIVNPASTLKSISKADLKKVYTGKLSKLGGQKATPVNLSDSDPLFTVFISQIIGMTPAQYKQFWVDNQVRGEGVAPVKVIRSTAKKIVASTPGAIAYIEESSVDASVKIITLK